ncbi:MAG: Yip1 family protein [Ignavibacteriaceae bacterium]
MISEPDNTNLINEEYIESPRLIDLFISPGKFFESTVKIGNKVHLILATIVFGIASAIDRFDMDILREQFGRSRGLSALGETWVGFWITVVVMGLISSFFIWTLGGWWYKTRLRFSGEENPDNLAARQIYIYSSFVYAAPLLLGTLVHSIIYENYFEATERDSILGIIVLVFLFGSLITSYIGARKIFNVIKWKALVWFIILPAIFYLVLIGAFAIIFQLQAEKMYYSDEIISENRIVTSTDNLFTLKLPDEWNILKNINPEASIQIGNLSNEVYLIAFSEDKSDLEDYTHSELYEAIVLNMVSSLEDGQLTETIQPSDTKHPYMMCEISGSLDGVKIIYLFALVECEKMFYQLVGWSLASEYISNKSDLKSVMYSFTELKDY